jgi:protein-S-isoprenylcysteine O-methyltransferase Ste14
MVVIYLGVLGLMAFIMGVAILGVWLRKHPSKANAEKSSRIMHFLFFAGLVAPGLISIFYPGLTHLDGLLGINSLPWKPFFLVVGIVLVIPGLYFFVASNKLLRDLGSGANAFRLTKQIVAGDVYEYTRNPMSLGFYLLSLSMAFISGSTLLTLAVLLGLVPAHLFFLKFFEELELGLRFGESYEQYKRKVPFLIPKLPAA